MLKRIDLLKLEVVKNALISITEEMSATLHRSAYSTNIKTRKDYSCALFDANQSVIAQSFSLPSHLGVTSRLVKKVIESYEGPLLEGDIIIVNDPYHGAGHLNDIALISPVFFLGDLIGYVVNMAHHVDVGGSSPASMPISTEIYQEGLIIPPLPLYEEGRLNRPVMELIQSNVRSKEVFLGDSRAQVASINTGLQRIGEVLKKYGSKELQLYMEEIVKYTTRRTLKGFKALPQGVFQGEDYLDDDGFSKDPILIKVQVHVDEKGILCDFTGSDSQRKSPMNAPLSITYAAVSFVLKCLIDEDIPVNEGFYRCIEVEAPVGTVVNVRPPSGVVGGYEVGQRVVSALFKAFSTVIPKQLTGASKGNIGHLGFGGYSESLQKEFTFLETIGGGFGGRLGADGMDGVQCDLTNTENAPVEETEMGYPVRIHQYMLIPDSEGAGEWRGGLGIRRDYQFLNPEGTTVTIFFDRARIPPWGILGGQEASPCSFSLFRDAQRKTLGSKEVFEVGREDIVSIKTSGGGGYGDPWRREIERVVEDVRQKKISKERAEEVYGVVFKVKGEVDEVMTSLRRENLSLKR